ncbi:MAG: hypothetical protein EBS19_13960 [Spirochaetia bacterium]|nr:hypothetical protein [Spirochaetia bacterium]
MGVCGGMGIFYLKGWVVIKYFVKICNKLSKDQKEEIYNKLSDKEKEEIKVTLNNKEKELINRSTQKFNINKSNLKTIYRNMSLLEKKVKNENRGVMKHGKFRTINCS